MNRLKALELAIRTLRKSRMPSVQAAVFALVDLRQGIVDRDDAERAARIAAFRTRLPRVA